MLSNLPKLLDRNFLIGFFVPALLTLFTISWAFPQIEALAPLRDVGIKDKDVADLVYIGLATWVMAILLMMSSHAVYRLFEGYLPPTSWLTFLKRRNQSRLQRLKSEYDKLLNEYGEAYEAGIVFDPAKLMKLRDLGTILSRLYPSTEQDVLPTRFGNAIRAFEVYPRETYGADGVVVWLRLASVIPKEFMALIDDARSRVDFFMNVCLLAFCITIAAALFALVQVYGHGLPHPKGLLSADRIWSFVTTAQLGRSSLVAILGGLIALLSYRAATGSVLGWGDLVRSAFDCYLPALIKQLGYAVPPTEEARKRFWIELNEKILYGQPMIESWPIAEATTQPKDKKPDMIPGSDTAEDEKPDT